MATLISNPPLADFILSEASGQRSRENAVVTQTGAAIPSGTLLMAGTAGKYVPYNGTVAANVATAILYSSLPAKTGDAKAVIFTADCEVKRSALIGLDAGAEADLLLLGIKVRGKAVPTVHTPAL